jgi:SAM-dependent methyltransferase
MSDTSFEQDALKEQVRDFWNTESCGERYAISEDVARALAEQSKTRYELEPYLPLFARFEEGHGRDVLEIGVGMGADHLEWRRHNPRRLTGVDLTSRAVNFTRARFEAAGLQADVRVADAETLPFEDASFDIVYSWGVLHHSPNTKAAIAEVRRVLRPGGTARIMIYHSRSIAGAVLWLRYALLAGRPGRRLSSIYAEHLESPGTKAYSLEETRALFSGFRDVTLRTELCSADLFLPGAGRRHAGALLTIARRLWPRALVRRFLSGNGLHLLIEARK